ncbi:MAG TPA: outer membrane protein assembly factor BamD, partial [Rhodobiaceae bacterium]|nr:outer membrane protein assembly factor BamD [Rhodobiaceae bacterium]
MDFARMSEARLPIRRNPAFSFRAILAGVFALAITGLAGCSSNDDEIPYEERPVEQIYNKAMDHMAAGEYIPATKEFDEVERQHP